MILSLLNNIKYCPSIKLMNCDIVDENAENTKLKKIEIKDIEDMVQKKCEDLNNQEAEHSTDEDTILSDKINYDINYLKKDLVHIMNYYGLSIRKKKKSDLIDDIVEFENEQIERLQDEVARSFGFKVAWHRHEIYGYCGQSGCEPS